MWLLSITFIFIVCSLFIDYSRKVNTFEKKEEKEESESECVRLWVNKSKVWERRMWLRVKVSVLMRIKEVGCHKIPVRGCINEREREFE